MIYYRNASGCNDPTAGEAMANIIRDEKRKLRSDRRKAQRKLNRRKRMEAEFKSSQKEEPTNAM